MRIKNDETARKTPRMACANLRRAIDAASHTHVEEYLAETETLLADNDRRGFHKYFEGTVELNGRKARGEQCVRNEHGTLPRDKVRILERWAAVLIVLSTSAETI